MAYHSYRKVCRRYINILSSTEESININTQCNAEHVTRYIETLALVGENRTEIIEDSTNKLKDFINKLYPLQIVRVLNAYSHLNFSNENILKTVLIRNEEMCDKSSPKRALELLTLYKSLNISHELILNDLSKCLIKHMNNYSYELYNLGMNASYLNMINPVFIESYKTQTHLKLDELNQLNKIKNVASFSRFRTECAELLDIIWKNKDNLDIKKSILMLSTFSRLNDERYKLISYRDSLTDSVKNMELSTEDISTILTLMRANSVAHVETINTIVNWIEMKLKDENYIKTHLTYHLFMLAQLVPEKIEKRLWSVLLSKVISNTEGFMNPKRMVQFVTTVAILKSGRLIEHINNEIATHIKSSYQKLNLKEQNQLYDCVFLLYGNSEDEVLQRIVRENRPNKLPLMYGNMKNVQLGMKGGKSVLYKTDKNGKLVAHKFVAENQALNIVNREVEMVLSPTTLLDLKVTKKLHKELEEYENEVEIIVLNERLKKIM
ncbi:conserved hypothetical protein [Theileria orientalis strain Shintoku]|uniref:RAP domain-containing protein n=1 Tax=Theileria orientalis strain Shintoku TaxID=869250 RepID=J4CCI0_THEOR|nr:conserved hypothetical protein [Theileria orientalis strain Shintoku]BAM39427.1 conserved hypothetical protein [Theileria orientalis strain Shintoku]|eukprot:XP_009689728.1 conserved hypothetical protein [Theileria orientalis strain Shintoku]